MHDGEPADFPLSRRLMIRGGLAAAGLVVLSGAWRPAAAASPRPLGPAARTLAFENLHTGERLSATYWENGRYDKGALAEINHLLRDHRTGDATAMDPALLDLLHQVRRAVRSRAAFQIISGYRSPATNAALAAKSGAVARRSFHMEGKAIDVRLPGTPLRALRDAAISLRGGGVGYYPRSNFVHLDVGPVRKW